MPLMFKKDGTTYHFPPYANTQEDYAFDFQDGITSGMGPSGSCLLGYRKGGQTYYAPCFNVVNTYMDGQYFRYRWDSSKPSLAVRKNSTTYHMANVRKYIYVRPKGSLNGTITYTRSKLSNGYYKVVFTVPFRVKAGNDPVAENAGSWRLNVYTPDDITCSISWGGTYSGTLQPSQTSETAYTATCTVTCTGGTDPMTVKDRWFTFEVENSTNNLSWYIGEKKVTEAWKDGYSIPAGTYTPSAFKNLISQYISTNGTRKCANAFTAKVNNQTISVSSGQTIAYKNCGSSPWMGTFVDFSGSLANVSAYSASSSFTNGKAYCVGLSNPSETGGGTGSYNNMFHSFTSYSITITTGINFS
ncbi:MAG: hypothetical protein J6S85_19670 [Methanobrevibacter sp.]|nr:hypothetical protein [Methanobrevibacter sp.]